MFIQRTIYRYIQRTIDVQSCAKIIEKTLKNDLLSLATSNLKLF